MKTDFKSTTILAVSRDGKTAVGGDGQVTMASTVIKGNALKLRRLYNDKVVVGFAGAVADAFSLIEKFEGHLEKYSGNVRRAAVEMAKEWRTSRMLRHLEALMVVASKDVLLLLSGTGEVIETDDNVIGIGSGGPYAVSAARAMLKFTEHPAKKIVEESLKLAAELCIYTNDNIKVEEI
jgi:ATP-dependent HslUV protease, peptidase subunit HslV